MRGGDGETLERACSGKALQIVPVELGAAARSSTLPNNRSRRAATMRSYPFSTDLARAENRVDCECIGAGFQSASHSLAQRVHRTHFDAMPARVCTSCEGV